MNGPVSKYWLPQDGHVLGASTYSSRYEYSYGCGPLLGLGMRLPGERGSAAKFGLEVTVGFQQFHHQLLLVDVSFGFGRSGIKDLLRTRDLVLELAAVDVGIVLVLVNDVIEQYDE